MMKLSSIISDGMVLQRNQLLTIWGETKPFEEVKVFFLEKLFRTTSNNKGEWSISIEPLEAGGPYVMEISGEEETIIIQDILIGDVWLLGGQSNMELPIRRTLDLFAKEMEAVHHPFIRQFSVPQNYNFHGPKKKLEGGNWISATDGNVMEFSAVGYFFAKELYETNGVPIGLIQTAVGGTPIEAWMSEETLREIGGYEGTLDKCKDDDYVAETKSKDEKRHHQWYKELNDDDLGLKSPCWYEESYESSGWKEFQVPNSWRDSELEHIRGSVWFRKEVEIPPTMVEGEAKLVLGTVVDADDTYINGQCIGTTGYKYPPRRYTIPKGLLRPGKNSITVRVISTHTTGGFMKGMPYKLVGSGQEIDLQGTWDYKIGAITETLESPTFFQYKPAGVFNAMIAPLKNYCLIGVLWYQGESNTHQPKGYHKLFERLVNDWRSNWKLGEIPFIYTQLANFAVDEGEESAVKWAELREEQRLSLRTSNTAMAVTIDIGEYNDLHPQDKKTLGQRLALCAKKLVYDKDIVYSGPLYRKMERIGKSIQLSFDHVGSGLVACNGKLKQFSICGANGEFVPATATIEGNTVMVKNNYIEEPYHVRYAWIDNPEGANLYNREGLPASPFTTENNE
ncbi:sialate O-acetylesterase [Evansella vedderi]|uniref:Sialate O-acetylesterase n=1 Tax=Evansella vedderi TaxID=38282 RepID=A0ABT9ZU80_9BACI|nr:sialate O-acetylesterase [Evansella vedderi]MDQ0254788.1 sialate O-acetylesterase [Evansella vedderi]